MSEETQEVDLKERNNELLERNMQLQHVVMVHGRILDEVARAARKFRLSGNPGVSAAGTQILALLPPD